MMYYKVVISRKGQVCMVTTYPCGQVMKNGDGTFSTVSAEWLIEEWHDRRKFGIDISMEVSG